MKFKVKEYCVKAFAKQGKRNRIEIMQLGFKV